LRILRGKLKDLATRGGGNTRWGGLVLITTEDEAIEVQGRFKIWQEWGETRVLGKRVYFESKVLKSFEEREEFGEGCSGLLEREQRNNEESFIDIVQEEATLK